MEDQLCIFRDETVSGTLILTLTLHRQSAQVRVQTVVCIYVAPAMKWAACSVYKPAFAQAHRGHATPTAPVATTGTGRSLLRGQQQSSSVCHERTNTGTKPSLDFHATKIPDSLLCPLRLCAFSSASQLITSISHLWVDGSAIQLRQNSLLM